MQKSDLPFGWTCCELDEEYLKGALGRLLAPSSPPDTRRQDDDSNYYRMPHPGMLWDRSTVDTLPQDGGKQRVIASRERSRMADVKHDHDAPAPNGTTPQLRLIEGEQAYNTDSD